MHQKKQLVRTSALVTGLGALLAAGTHTAPAHAWDVITTLSDINEAFVVDLDESDASGWSFNRVQDGIDAASGFQGIPINFTFQPAGDTPLFDEILNGPAAQAYGRIETFDPGPGGFMDYAEAYVIGEIEDGFGYAGRWVYEFQLTLDPGVTVTLALLEGFASLSAESNSPNDLGFAFGSIKLFSIDFDLNVPGGANQPYKEDSVFASGPSNDPPSTFTPSFSHTFTNEGSEVLTLNLWLEGNALVFQTIPEPASAMLLIGGATMLMLRRRMI